MAKNTIKQNVFDMFEEIENVRKNQNSIKTPEETPEEPKSNEETIKIQEEAQETPNKEEHTVIPENDSVSEDAASSIKLPFDMSCKQVRKKRARTLYLSDKNFEMLVKLADLRASSISETLDLILDKVFDQ